jgi:hypothetical protein
MTNITNGFLIVNDMMLQRNKPDFRIDENYEDHVIQLFSHFSEYAVSKKLTIILTGRCVKSPSIKQALMLAALKSRCNLMVAEWESSSVNPALIEMNCIELLRVENASFFDSKVHVSDVIPSDIDNYETVILLNSHPEVMYKSLNGWKSLQIPSSIQRVDGVQGCSIEITKSRLKPKFVSALYDDSDVIKDDDDVSGSTMDFGFIEKLKNLNRCQREMDITVVDSAISPLQQAINSMELSYASEQVQSLFNDALSERQDNNQLAEA